MLALAYCSGTTVTTFIPGELEWSNGGQEYTVSLALGQIGVVVTKEQ